jgi:hypothetical protein
MHAKLAQSIFSIQNEAEFDALCLEVFHFQEQTNKVYKGFVSALGLNPDEVKQRNQIPFLPIEFFKTDNVTCKEESTEMIFTSSGTSGLNTSSHHVADLQLYEMSYRKAFEHFYGNIEEYCLVALLPSYSERQGSSLIYMVDDLIKRSKHALSGYYLNADETLKETLLKLNLDKHKTLLLGVSYALLDFAEKFTLNLDSTIVMETGGMKGRRKEIVREELHVILKNSFGVDVIHSEYGMTELLSQAYSKGEGRFFCPPWMRVEAREIDDPLSPALTQKTGGLNVIDLANLNSCSFISTQDLVKVYPNHSFEVLGRFDNSDIRGCNLLL